MITEEIRKDLFSLKDIKYRDFQVKLIPGCEIEKMIGVRTPDLKTLAKKYFKMDGTEGFLHDLPHKYFDEDQLHAFIISLIKDFESCVKEVDGFLPYVNNWATCDQMSPVIFKKHRQELLIHIKRWIASDETYTIRFGIGMLMQHFLDDAFDESYPEMVANVSSDEYYVNMMRAWYFATALAKQYETALPYITEYRLDAWTHNKTISKAVDSYRITDEQKSFLKGLRLANKYGSK
ncbi:MAG: DNA alkylation repair protein [Lachnospiraceae bacterium]|nr:DNA alkylation repair protein [Lachnospiraceae bacterium]